MSEAKRNPITEIVPGVTMIDQVGRNPQADSLEESLGECIARRYRMAEAAPDLLAALAWAVDQIEDDLDPDHQEALAAARSLVAKHQGRG